MRPQGSQCPALVACCLRTKGPILEIAPGYFSTLVLQEFARAQGRELMCLETDVQWFKDLHQQGVPVRKVLEYPGNKALQRSWGLAVIDAWDEQVRADCVRALRGHTKVLTVHAGFLNPIKGVLREWKYGVWLPQLRPWSSAIVSDVIDVREWGLLGAVHMHDTTGRAKPFKRSGDKMVSGGYG